MENNEIQETQQNNDVSKLIEDVEAYGDLLLIANKGIGKTNALMVLAEEFRKLPDTRVIIFEDFPKFSLEFSEMPYFIVHDSDVVETEHNVDIQDYFLLHLRDYKVNRGEEILEALENTKDLIFCMEITDIERSAFFVYSIVQYFYRKAYLRKYKNYQKKERVVFIIEESQNVFDSSTISKKIFNRLRKIFSVARNLDLHFVLASQRLQDLNTKIRGRTRLLLGQINIDDYELKIRRLVRNSQYKTEILSFPVGTFLYVSNDSLVRFPKFLPNGKPFLWTPRTKPEPKKAVTFFKIEAPRKKSKTLETVKTLARTFWNILSWTPKVQGQTVKKESFQDWESEEDEFSEEIDSEDEEEGRDFLE